MYAKVAQNHETKEGKVKNDLIYIILHTFEYKGKKTHSNNQIFIEKGYYNKRFSQ